MSSSSHPLPAQMSVVFCRRLWWRSVVATYRRPIRPVFAFKTLPPAAAQMSVTEVFWKARCQRTYAAAHTYHINSISVSSDQETFISTDDLRVNLW